MFTTTPTELTVSQFLKTLNVSLRQYRVMVSGEVTGRVNRRGAVTYFSLHDPEEEAVLQCMGFNNILDSLGIELTEGMAIRVGGYPEVWERSGGFSFKVFEILLTGEGALKKQFQALLKKLEAEGLFSPEYKKSLPRFAKHIGLITSEGREAQTDFLTHIARRGLSIELYDVRVEGAQAVEQIVEAIEYFNKYSPETEVLVLTRGGGSLESLQAFNSEAVARAIFASQIPIISAVGHEKDVTVADFVADIRASTPTHAGKIISAGWEQADTELQTHMQQLHSLFYTIVQNSAFKTKDFLNTISMSLKNHFQNLRSILAHHMAQLRLVSPELKLKQGYSIVTSANGSIIKSVDRLAIGDKIGLRFHKGTALAHVYEKTNI